VDDWQLVMPTEEVKIWARLWAAIACESVGIGVAFVGWSWVALLMGSAAAFWLDDFLKASRDYRLGKLAEWER
jgi:hypothetical protein